MAVTGEDDIRRTLQAALRTGKNLRKMNLNLEKGVIFPDIF